MIIEYPEPKIRHCVEWIINMKHNPAYCRECIDLWRNTFGESFAEKVTREVRKECSKQKKPNPLDD